MNLTIDALLEFTPRQILALSSVLNILGQRAARARVLLDSSPAPLVPANEDLTRIQRDWDRFVSLTEAP